MEPSRPALAVAALSLGLGTASWFFDSTLLLASAAVLSVLLSYRAAVFLRGLRTMARGLTVTRETGSLIVRQGSPVTVRLIVKAPVPPGMRLSVREELPLGAVLRAGPVEATGMERGSGGLDLEYSAAFFNAGEIAFPGVTVTLEDPFFSSQLRDSRPASNLPALHVEPSGRFVFSGKGGLYGQEERELQPLIRGSGIRGFRLYRPGDDMKTIDWKLSAKYDRTFVREYTGVTSARPFLVADLPDAGTEFSAEAFERLRAAMYDAIVAGQKESIQGRVLLVSGPNIVAFRTIGHEAGAAAEVIAAMIPVSREHHLYRAAGQAGARSFGRMVARERESATGAGFAYLSRLSEVLDSFQQRPPATAFDRQLDRVFSLVDARVIYLFSSFSGDQSHTKILAMQARKRGMSVQAITPGIVLPAGLRRSLSGWGIETVEAAR